MKKNTLGIEAFQKLTHEEREYLLKLLELQGSIYSMGSLPFVPINKLEAIGPLDDCVCSCCQVSRRIRAKLPWLKTR